MIWFSILYAHIIRIIFQFFFQICFKESYGVVSIHPIRRKGLEVQISMFSEWYNPSE